MFVPSDFEVPTVVEADGFRLEPLGPEHNERDHAAWMGSIEFIPRLPGMHRWAGNWPVPMSLDDNLADLVQHRREFDDRAEFAYSLLVGDDVVGCLYIDPGTTTDTLVISWVTEDRADLDPVVRRWVSSWLADVWPFDTVEYDGV